MRNIFSNMFKNSPKKEPLFYLEAHRNRQSESNKGLIVMGYSAVNFDLHPNARVNNYNNL